ncbi:MAG TPA: CHAT domain-containing protein [Longimicrobiales bacterium]|nr:CHAT domain-containing protein [Longimicrobiales bacterium]
MSRRYENFDIEVLRAGDSYTARVRSPRGEAQATFQRPLTEHEQRILGLTVARGRRTTRSVQTREVDDVKAWGQQLFDAVFTGDVLACYHESVSHIRADPGTGLRIRLRLADAPELAEVPWEYLYDRRSGRFLALDEETPVVRYLDLPLQAPPLLVEPPLRVLVMISSPEDVPGLDSAAEWELLNRALADLAAAGAVQLHKLERATISALRWELKRNDYHVFHFIGHGGVDAITERGILLLEDEHGRSDPVEAEVLAGVLSAERSLRLAVLNACEGGRASHGDIFAGTAQALVQQDVPAVIAMQFEISDQAAIALTHDFYKALSMGDPVDAALTEARRGLRYELRNELEWGTPVLYMRAADGRLFSVRDRPALASAIESAAADTDGTAGPAAAASGPAPQPAAPRHRPPEVPAPPHAAAELPLAAMAVPASSPEPVPAATVADRKDRSDRQVLWMRIGKFAVGLWVFGLLVALLVPDDEVLLDPGPVDDWMPQAVQPDPGAAPPTVEAPQQQPASPPIGSDAAPAVRNAPTAAAPASAAPSRDAEAATLGLVPYGSAITGSLGYGESTVHNVRLEGGATFIIAGSCDAACNDLDLAVSEMGVIRVQDVDVDAEPVLTAPVLATGTYQLIVSMAQCNAPSCAYRVQVYH